MGRYGWIPETSDTIVGVSMMRILAFGCLCWGPPIYGNYRTGLKYRILEEM